jgi:hypothetical protein
MYLLINLKRYLLSYVYNVQALLANIDRRQRRDICGGTGVGVGALWECWVEQGIVSGCDDLLLDNLRQELVEFIRSIVKLLRNLKN